MLPRVPLLLALLLLTGCGSRVNEANYYKVGAGTPEEKVDEWLGPSRPAEVPALVGRRDVKARYWEAGALKITLLFENGHVIGRKAEGLTGGKEESFDWPEAATRPVMPSGRSLRDPA